MLWPLELQFLPLYYSYMCIECVLKKPVQFLQVMIVIMLRYQINRITPITYTSLWELCKHKFKMLFRSTYTKYNTKSLFKISKNWWRQIQNDIRKTIGKVTLSINHPLHINNLPCVVLYLSLSIFGNFK
jgi:hypothetical protein